MVFFTGYDHITGVYALQWFANVFSGGISRAHPLLASAKNSDLFIDNWPGAVTHDLLPV
jgi:hypothetical protein